MSDEQLKRCTKCREWKPATTDYFVRHTACQDGLYTQCKTCKQTKDRARWARDAGEINERRRNIIPEKWEHTNVLRREWRTNNRERVLASKRRYYWANRDADNAKSREWGRRNPERKREYGKQYLQSNRRKIQQRQRRWEKDNKERLLQKRRNDYAINPVSRRLSYIKREATKRSVPSLFTQDDMRYCLEWFGHRCAACESTEELHMDHWIPLIDASCPGTIKTNMIPLCKSCNCSKQDSEANTWLVWRFGDMRAKQIAERVASYFSTLPNDATS